MHIFSLKEQKNIYPQNMSFIANRCWFLQWPLYGCSGCCLVLHSRRASRLKLNRPTPPFFHWHLWKLFKWKCVKWALQQFSNFQQQNGQNQSSRGQDILTVRVISEKNQLVRRVVKSKVFTIVPKGHSGRRSEKTAVIERGKHFLTEYIVSLTVTSKTTCTVCVNLVLPFKWQWYKHIC